MERKAVSRGGCIEGSPLCNTLSGVSTCRGNANTQQHVQHNTQHTYCTNVLNTKYNDNTYLNTTNGPNVRPEVEISYKSVGDECSVD